jgi:ureidoglycolate lyase
MTPANNGTAQKYNFLAALENRRPQSAVANCSVFSCAPFELDGERSLKVRELERHSHSTQGFLPMNATRYVIIVAQNDPNTDQPDLSTLKAFVVAGNQSITYFPGTWHHPMIALETRIGMYMCVYVGVYAVVCVCMCVCTCVVCIYVYVCVCRRACMYMCVCACAILLRVSPRCVAPNTTSHQWLSHTIHTNTHTTCNTLALLPR